jgi:hypothetical protein
MTPLEYGNLIRSGLKMTSVTLTGDEIVNRTNEVLPIVEEKINDRDNLGRNILGVIGYADFEDGEREYPFPPDLLNKIIGVEVKLSATEDWIPLESFDLNNYNRTTDEATIISQFKAKPQYDIYRESLWIYSDTITNVAEGNQGLKLWYLGEFKRLANVTEASVHMETAPTGEADEQNFKRGIPKSIQYWLVRYIRKEIKEENEIALTEYETNIWSHLDEIISKLNPIDTKQTVEFNTPDLSRVGRYGFDL